MSQGLDDNPTGPDTLGRVSLRREAAALARVTPPEWPDDLVSRPRLVAVLEECVRLQRVTALCAPTGYGKTVLLTDYARQSGRRVVWLRLAEGDSEEGTFLRDLACAI